MSRAGLLDFAVALGTTSTVILKDLSPGYAFAATWGADTSGIESVMSVASGSAALNDPGPFVSIALGGDTLSLRGTCRDFDCTRVSVENTATISPPTFRPVGDVTPVPLPPSAALIAVGALALAAAARRRPPAKPRAAP